jgi:general stress protein CsbA
MKKSIMFFLVIGIILVIILVEAATYRYYVDTIYYNSTSSTSFSAGGTVTANCIFHQHGSTYTTAVVGCASYLQWNSSTQAWINLTGSGTVYTDGSNPDSTSLPKVSGAQNFSVVSHTITFPTAGTYNIRCYEPSETCNTGFGALTSTIKTYTITTSCTYSSGNWAVNCADNCVVSSNINGDGSNFTATGSGRFVMTANISGFKVYRFSGGCNATCKDGGCIRI